MLTVHEAGNLPYGDDDAAEDRGPAVLLRGTPEAVRVAAAHLYEEVVVVTPAELARLRRIEQTARGAVPYVLGRAQNDSGLGMHLGPGTESWSRLVECEAALTGKDLDEVRVQRGGFPRPSPWRRVGEHRWAADTYTVVREDVAGELVDPAPWLDPAPDFREMLDVTTRAVAEGAVHDDPPAGFVLATDNDVGRRTARLRESSTIYYTGPCAVFVRNGEPIALVALAKAD